jgi:hypothetical protein
MPVRLYGVAAAVYHFVNGLVPPPAGMSEFMLGFSSLAGILVFAGAGCVVDRRWPVAGK